MKTFCCCLPVRIGVFVIAPVTFVIAGFLAYVGWTSFHLYMTSVTMLQNVITVLFALSSTLLCLFSVAGFVGTLMASLPLISAYSRMLFAQWIIDLGVNIGYIVLWIGFAKANLVNQCVIGSGTFLSNLQGNLSEGLQNATSGLANATAPLGINPINDLTGSLNNATSQIFDADERLKLCNAGFELVKIIFIVIFVVYKLISLYGCFIAHWYVQQLRSEATEQRWHDVERKVGTIQATQTAQMQQQAQAAQYAFTTPQSQVAGGGAYAGYRA